MKDKIIIIPGDKEEDTNFRLRQQVDRLASYGKNAREIADELGLDIKEVGNIITGG